MSTAQVITLTPDQLTTVVLLLVLNVREWESDPTAHILLEEAWDALEAVETGRVTLRPGETRRTAVARLYGLAKPAEGE